MENARTISTTLQMIELDREEVKENYGTLEKSSAFNNNTNELGRRRGLDAQNGEK